MLLKNLLWGTGTEMYELPPASSHYVSSTHVCGAIPAFLIVRDEEFAPWRELTLWFLRPRCVSESELSITGVIVY